MKINNEYTQNLLLQLFWKKCSLSKTVRELKKKVTVLDNFLAKS